MSTAFFESRSVTVSNEHGLHMRPAHLLAELAGKFDCQIEIEKDELRVDAKSALSILTLGATCGTHLNLYASGPQAARAISELAELISSRFPDEITGSNKR